MKNREQIAALVVRVWGFHATDQQERLRDAVRRWIEDPLRPKTDKGSLRVNPILVLLALMALLAGGTFLFFSLVQL
jgi:hypothetical protein